MQVIAHDRETLDELAWRSVGRTAGVTEAALALNPGLAAGGPQIAEGTIVTLPDLAAAAPAIRETVQLWD
ncbi:MAG: phage tail protein [Sphingomonadales bacterium RIFCSPHIGHO2_01_FULL_65_20]|nr:MAG: phage tail protein [Sphingomonadales bacterium RIFCSPHIGHO2_01_FULL_65_20]